MVFDSVIFDLDGTLLDSAPAIGAIFNQMRLDLGRPGHPIHLYRQWVSLGASVLVANAMGAAREEVPPLLAEFRQRYAALRTSCNELFPHASRTVHALHCSGIKLAICSNKPENLCAKVLAETGLLRYFRVVVGGDTVSPPKPNRKPIDFLLGKLCAERSRAIFVGDTVIDAEAAGAAGVKFAFFAAGYDDGVNRQSADWIMHSLGDLRRIVGINTGDEG